MAKGAAAVGQLRMAKTFYIQAAMHRLWHRKKFCKYGEDHGHKHARISCLYQAKLIIEKLRYQNNSKPKHTNKFWDKLC